VIVVQGVGAMVFSSEKMPPDPVNSLPKVKTVSDSGEANTTVE
jgi:hypothetical protein